MNKILLKGPYFPEHSYNRMQSEGNVSSARSNFINNRFRNLDHLLVARYMWMKNYIRTGWKTLEIGAGAGFSELYLKHKPIMTDAVKNPWIDKVLDATKMDIGDLSVDCIIASHTIHHFHSPYKFFKECERVIKPGGLILIQELNTSFALRALLYLMRHEGWSYDVDVFDQDAIANDPNDLWSANCAIPELLFEQPNRFEREFGSLKIELNQKNEFLIFPLSGGVIAKASVPQLSTRMLNFVSKLDKLFTSSFPNIFAMGRSVVIRKIG